MSGRPLLASLAAALIAGLAQPAAAQRIDWEAERNRLVDEEIAAAGVLDQRVLDAMRATRRHEFVPLAQRRLAYRDMALPIGASQTISPPFVVAFMTEQLDPQPSDRVLEIGTGSGYQAAVLSPLVKDVYTIEIVPSLGKRAARVLKRLDYDNVSTRVGDGYLGWPEAAPFDKIIVTCSPESPPPALVKQLAEGGRMVIPLGERFQQNLCLLRKVDGKLRQESLRATLFVPMTGSAEERREVLPDPQRPSLVNGSFEDLASDSPDEQRPAAWHYLRQATVVEEPSGVSVGRRALRFENDEPGLHSQALQGFAVDGRVVKRVDVSARVKGEDVRFGQSASQWPYLVVTFYDDQRAWLGDELIGPFRGTFDWKSVEKTVSVPPRTREAGFRIGLLGAIGRLWVDDLRLERAGDDR